jgi:rhodanese-related sulfurtransferase
MSSQTPLRRDVILMVIAGAVLGIAYNGMGLASRPPRGIAWVAVETALPTLEDPAPGDSVIGAPDGAVTTPEATSPPTPERTSVSPVTPSAPLAVTTKPPAGSGEASPPADTSVPEPQRAAPLPFIPDSDQPIQMQVATVKRFFDARGALFLDARDPAEYEKGHIPGAIRLTNVEAQNEPERLKALPSLQGKPTIVYCEGGACEASLELARFLIESGWKKVLVYMGGYPEWQAAGHPVSKGSAP